MTHPDDVPRETAAISWSAPEELAGDQLVAGAPALEASGAPFDPVPVVAINGVDVASGAASPADTLMAVDGLRITWGRDGVLDQPTPATGRLVLFDTTRTWATRQDVRGLPVTIRYEGTAPDGSAVSRVIFRGRIGAPVNVAPKDAYRRADNQLVRGAVVELPLQAALLDLANNVPRVAWPAETMGARFDRVIAAAQAAGHLTGGGVLRSYWRTPNVAPVAAKDQVSLLDHLTALFDSAGADNYTYRPDTDDVVYLPRRNYPNHRSLGRLWWDGTDPAKARAGQGAYVQAMDVVFTEVPNGVGTYLDTGTLEFDPSDGVGTPARITRVAMTHPDEAAAYADVTTEVPVRREPWDPAGGHAPLDERVLGVRTARTDSLVAWNAWADQSLDDTQYLVRREGSRWQLPPVRFSSRKLGGFETVAHAEFLIGGYESNGNAFLQRSFLPALGLRPVFGVQGAVIEYRRRGWDVEFTPSPVTTQTTQHALTFEDLATEPAAYRIEAWDAPHPKGMHPSVTFEDLRFCGGLLSAAFPAETERDEYQA